MKTIRIGGFFSGIGAHHSAVNRIAASRPDLSFKVVFQCEIDEKTATAYDLMHGETLNLQDVTQVNDIGGNLAADILFWTPPCQDISLANNNRQGNKAGSGTRSSLAFEVPRILANTPEEERPRYLVFEEVPMMISKDYIDNFKEIIQVLSTLGYTSNYGIMNACDYGVAQNRRRCFMVSKLNGAAPSLPAPMKLTRCLRDYLEPEPVDKSYYLKPERIKGLIWSTEKQNVKGNGFKFEPTDGKGIAHAITTSAGSRKTDNFLEL